MQEENFSYRMRRFREERGLRQDELAAALGVTARYIGMIERGQKEVEPSSSLYKLFILLEQNKIPLDTMSIYRSPESHDHRVHAEEGPYRPIHAGASLPLSVRDALDQVKADLHVLEFGTPADKRRTMMFLREVHLPFLAKALKLDL